MQQWTQLTNTLNFNLQMDKNNVELSKKTQMENIKCKKKQEKSFLNMQKQKHVDENKQIFNNKNNGYYNHRNCNNGYYDNGYYKKNKR